jgi:tRNA/rRNA methyltransferase
VVNLRNIFTRMALTRQDVQTLQGVLLALAEGRKGPARGGILDGAQAQALRALIAEQAGARTPGEQGPVRGLARLLRRNPTDAERALWDALTKDRRFADCGFKRQTPVGPHVADLVSFPLRLVIDVVPEDESAAANDAREARRGWFEKRGYSLLLIAAAEAAHEPEKALAHIADAVAAAKTASQS